MRRCGGTGRRVYEFGYMDNEMVVLFMALYLYAVD